MIDKMDGGGKESKERLAYKAKQDLDKVQEGDTVSITAEKAIKGKVTATMDGGFSMQIEHPANLKGAEMEVRLKGAVTGGLGAPFDQSVFYTITMPDGRRLPETQSPLLREVKIER